MLNVLWIGLVLGAILCGAVTGKMEAVTHASIVSAKAAVTLALGLVGVMAFWLGMINIAREAGLMQWVALRIKPIMIRLFPDVPAEHPAMSAMIMNMSANLLGLANAATPFGLKAMMELDKLNARKGEATNAMALFLAINTSNIALFPTGVIAVRASLGSNNAAGIVFTTLFATCCSTAMAILAAKWLSRLPYFALSPLEGRTIEEAKIAEISTEKLEKEIAGKEPSVSESASHPPSWSLRLLNFGFWGTLLISIVFFIGNDWLQQWERALLFSNTPQTLLNGFQGADAFDGLRPFKQLLSFWLLPILMATLVLYGINQRVKVYEALVTGAKEGFDVAIKIIPYLVAILVAVAMFRASGGIEVMKFVLSPFTSLIGMPAEALPMAILRPMSGSGAYGVMAEIMTKHGPDSMIGYMVSTFQGSTETTFYVMAVYFGAIQIKNSRHTLVACLMADVTGILTAVWICKMLFG